MRLRLGIPKGLSRRDMASALNAALEASTAGQAPLIASGRLPTFVQGLRAKGIRWKPEPPGDEHFDMASTVMRRGWGDCDDLAPWHAASLRATGEDEDARAVVKPSGPGRWHAVVVRGDGDIEDPSLAAGMPSRPQVNGALVAGGALAPAWSPMFPDGRMAIAVHPYLNGWAARIDAPDAEEEFDWSAVRTGRTPAAAVNGCIAGLQSVCGDELDDMTSLRLLALQDLLYGVPARDVQEALAYELDGMGYDPDESVGILPALIPAAASIAAPLISSAASRLFGGGGGRRRRSSPRSSAASAASPSGILSRPPSGGASSPGATLAMPGGPIIVKF